MKLKTLLNEYKNVSKEIRTEAKNYNYLSRALRIANGNKDIFSRYQNSWKKIISLNERSYQIMYEYRKICGSWLYRFLFFFGILKKQNTFRYIDNTKTWFKYDQFINLIYLK